MVAKLLDAIHGILQALLFVLCLNVFLDAAGITIRLTIGNQPPAPAIWVAPQGSQETLI